MLALLLCLVACNRPPAPPDVVLVVVDTLRADSLGFAGHTRPTSPHLDQLAKEATWFSRAYSPSTWTLPATASLFTGQYPFQHRVVHDWRDPDMFGRLVESIPNLPDRFREDGYRSAAFVNNAFLAPDFGLHKGFDTYDYEGAALSNHRTAQQTVDTALDWLNASDQPALVVIHVMEPHADYTAPAPYAGRFTKDLPHTVTLPLGDVLVDALILETKSLSPQDRVFIRHAYDEEILTADAALGSLLEALRSRKGWDALRLVVTSDHGEEFWEFDRYEHGHTTRSVVTQVPLILKAPGVKPGRNQSVVDLTLVPDALAGDEESVLLKLARTGTERGRYALSEDILYGPQEISIVTDELRLIIQQEAKTATLLRLNEKGWEVEDLSLDPTQRERGRALYEAAVALRGNVDRTAAINALAMPDSTVFEQLRTLGYVQ
jgi:arylsulfatase A-like enzyme